MPDPVVIQVQKDDSLQPIHVRDRLRERGALTMTPPRSLQTQVLLSVPPQLLLHLSETVRSTSAAGRIPNGQDGPDLLVYSEHPFVLSSWYKIYFGNWRSNKIRLTLRG